MSKEIDILNRQEFIDKIISTVEYHSKNNLKASFSIQGEWGCGKTWILDRVFEELYDIQDFKIAGGRYCVFRYNAWEYDYYDEPLVSLLISLKEQLDSNKSIHFKTTEAPKKYQAVKQMLKEKLLDDLDVFQKNPLFAIIDAQTLHIPRLICSAVKIKKEFEKYKDKVKDEIRQYDPHYDLNQLMNSMIKGLNRIADEKIIVVIVDELDRCLPEHAIKVLERMHHISQNVNNIQFIYGIDKTQIENNVAQIFVSEHNNEKCKYERIKRYLSKFITFGLKVPKAEYTGEIKKKYPSLFNSFGSINTSSFDVIEKIRTIASIVSPRFFEQIVQKIILSNGILNLNKEKLDNSILVFELFYAIVIENDLDLSTSQIKHDLQNRLLKLDKYGYNDSPIINVFNNLISSNPIIYSHIGNLSYNRTMFTDFEEDDERAVFEASMIFYYEGIKNQNYFCFESKRVTNEMTQNVSYLKQFISYYISLEM